MNKIVIRKICSKISTRISEKYISKFRKKKLLNNDFSIISNNCWAGWVYRRYGVEYKTPTVGLFIMPSDYIIFLKNLKEYIEMDMEFIKPEDSKYKEYISSKDKRFGSYPIGKLNDIEIHFLHYKSSKEAYEKWNRRKQRINFKNLIVKFNDQNGCSYEEVKEFFKLPYNNKIFFTANKDWTKSEAIYIKEYAESRFVEDDMLFCTKYLNLTKYINNIKIGESKNE